MCIELTMLAWTLVLALVQVFLPIIGRTRQLGSKWNAGPRDEPLPPPDPVTGRLERAQRNLYETLPIYIAAVLVVELQNIHTLLTGIAAWLYPLSRIAYMPLYAYGVPGPRTAAFAIGMMGVGALIIAPFLPA